MWALASNKRAFLDFFGNNGLGTKPSASLVKSDILELELSDEFLLLWERKPSIGDLPATIIVPDQATREFIAWATTAIGGYRPFTAFFKVINKTIAKQAIKLKEPKLGDLESPLAGLIIGEALTQSINSKSLQNLSLLPCMSTYSFSLARAFALGYYNDTNKKDTITDSWLLARRLTHQPTRTLEDESIHTVFRVATSLDRKDTSLKPNVQGVLIEVCRELCFQGNVKKGLDILGALDPALSKIAKEMEGPREKRVRTFESVVKSPINLDPTSSAFVIGLLASLISQGTFEHIELLMPHISEYKTALLWYGLCVGLYKNNVVQESANCLGRRLVRELKSPDPLVSAPSYDISIGELEVCLDRESPINFRVASKSHITVEIAPGVPAIMRWPISTSTVEKEKQSSTMPSTTTPRPTTRQDELFPQNTSNDLWDQGENALLKLDLALKSIKGVFSELKQGRRDTPKSGTAHEPHSNKHR